MWPNYLFIEVSKQRLCIGLTEKTATLVLQRRLLHWSYREDCYIGLTEKTATLVLQRRLLHWSYREDCYIGLTEKTATTKLTAKIHPRMTPFRVKGFRRFQVSTDACAAFCRRVASRNRSKGLKETVHNCSCDSQVFLFSFFICSLTPSR